MYTQCPQCRASQPLSVSQLRANRGFAYCRRCRIKFDALEFLNEHAPTVRPRAIPTAPATASTEQALPWEQARPSRSSGWLSGAVALGLLLLAQGVYFEGRALTQHHNLRPLLQQLCQPPYCRLPAYQNAAELTVVNSSLSRLPDRNYVFTAAIFNQAPFPQPTPRITVKLMDFNGQIFARRTFTAAAYLSYPESQLGPDSVLPATLYLAAPRTGVGGYVIDIND